MDVRRIGMKRGGFRTRLSVAWLAGSVMALMMTGATAQTVIVDSNGWREEQATPQPSSPADTMPMTPPAPSPAPERTAAAGNAWQTTVIGGDGSAVEQAGYDAGARAESPAAGPARIGRVALRGGGAETALTIDLSQAADFVFWAAPDGRRVVVFVPGAPSDAMGRGEGGLIREWRCIEGPSPGCALAIDLTRPVTVESMRLQRPEETGGAYRIRLALEALDGAPFVRDRTGIAWQGGGSLPPMWENRRLEQVAEAPRSGLANGGDGVPAARIAESEIAPQPARTAATIPESPVPGTDTAQGANQGPNPQTGVDLRMDSETAIAAARVDCAVEPDVCQDPAPWDTDYLKGFYEVPWEMAKRPFDFSKRALIIDAIALGGFGALYAVDESIRDEVQDSQSGGADDFFDAVEVGGRFYGLLAVGAGAWATGEVVGDRSMQRAGLNGFQAVLLAAIPVEGTKALFGRSRPLKDEGNGDWFGSGNSFLSGHTTYAFAAASAVAHEYDHVSWVPWLAYGAAGLVGAQRIYDDKHWSSDVFLSALVGWGIGQAVSDLDAFAEDSPMDVGALRTGGAQGLSVSMDF